MRVFIVDMNEEPLMPCKPRIARLLLKSRKAIRFRKDPFTIKMLIPTGNYKQEITIGVDTGYKNVGISASTEKEELFSAEIELRTDIIEKLSTRREWRRTRRNQLEYRKPRFKRKKGEGWLSPSIRSKIDAHFFHIKRLTEIMPVSKIIVETAAFDIQKIKNPDIEGKEYQQGEQFCFWNVREYVLYRDHHTCQKCKGKSKDPILNVHHIESRKVGGDAPNNLITLCETCHKKIHDEKANIKFKIEKERGESFKTETFMNTMRKYLFQKLMTLKETLV